jgi:hypothetical protein
MAHHEIGQSISAGQKKKSLYPRIFTNLHESSSSWPDRPEGRVIGLTANNQALFTA